MWWIHPSVDRRQLAVLICVLQTAELVLLKDVENKFNHAANKTRAVITYKQELTCASPVKLDQPQKNNKWRLQRTKHISILKSFIVLQKSNYYLTRKKDKWQIIYITNARPPHIVPSLPPPFTWHSKNKSTFSFQTASKKKIKENQIKPLRMNLRFGCLSSLLWFEVRKWHVALHSFVVLVRSLPYLSRTLLRGRTGEHGQGRFPVK